MKKRIIIISSVIILALVIIGIYSTFASEETTISDNSYNITLSDNNNELTIPANSSKTVIYRVTNTNRGKVKYGLAYDSDNINVKVYDNSSDEITGYIDYGETKFIKLHIKNNSDSDSAVSIKTVLGYENGGELEGTPAIPSGYTLVSETYYSTVILAPSTSWYKGITDKTTITKIIFTDNYRVTENETESWPAGVDKDGDGVLDSTIMCYINGTELTISSTGHEKVYANEDSSSMFLGFSSLTTFENLEMLDTSKVINMSWMFNSCISLIILDLSSFDTSNCTSMSAMFSGMEKLVYLNIKNFKTSNVTDMGSMFYDCFELPSLDISNFDTSKVTNMSYMFNHCSKLVSLELSSFDTSKVINMNSMFNYNSILKNIYVSSKWTTENVETSNNMFNNCLQLTGEKGTSFNSNYTDKTYAKIDGGTSNPGYLTNIVNKRAFVVYSETDNSLTFYNNANEVAVGATYNNKIVTTIYTGIETDIYHTGDNPAPWHNYAKVITKVEVIEKISPISTASWFEDFYNCTSMDLTKLDTSRVTTMDRMFCDCRTITNLNLSGFDTSNVTQMGAMFYDCLALESVDLSSFDTKKVTVIDSMFGYNEVLRTIYVSNKWTTENIIASNNMFTACYKLTGEAGTVWNSDNPIDKTYARIDGGTSNPGYFTLKTN